MRFGGETKTTNDSHTEKSEHYDLSTHNTINQTAKGTSTGTIMATALAASIIIPILNQLIQKAINRWNEEIPGDMQQEANQEYNLLMLKCEALAKTTEGYETNLRRVRKNVNARDFLELQKEINLHMRKVVLNATRLMLDGYTRKDQTLISRGLMMMNNMESPFKTSIESYMHYESEPEKIGVFSYDQTIQCLTRITPSSILCNSRTVLNRSMAPMTHFGVNEQDTGLINTVLCSIYDVRSQMMSDGTYSVLLTPKTKILTPDMLHIIYGIDLTMISNAHFFGRVQMLPWYIANDSNFSPASLMEKKLGHSLSVVGEVISEVVASMIGVLRHHNRKEAISQTVRRVEVGPWKSGINIRQFSNPISLFANATDQSIIALDDDFAVCIELVRLIGSVKRFFPDDLETNDPILEDYIFRSMLEQEKSFHYSTVAVNPPPTLERNLIEGKSNVGRSKSPPLLIKMASSETLSGNESLTESSAKTTLDKVLAKTKIQDQLKSGLSKMSQLTKKQRETLIQSEEMTPYAIGYRVNGKGGMIYSVKIYQGRAKIQDGSTEGTWFAFEGDSTIMGDFGYKFFTKQKISEKVVGRAERVFE